MLIELPPKVYVWV